MFCEAEPATEPPPPKAVFTSNPLRSLGWLLDLWAEWIAPKVAGAELHLFTGAATYGSVGDAKADAMERSRTPMEPSRTALQPQTSPTPVYINIYEYIRKKCSMV